MKHIYTKLTFLLLLLLGSTSLFGNSSTYYSKVTVAKTGSGTVYVKAGSTFSGTNTSDTQNSDATSAPTHTYSINATAADGYTFSSWSGSGVTIKNASSASTTCTITANSTNKNNPTSGTATATFTAVTVSSVNSNTTSSSSPLKVVSPSTAYYATVKFTVANADATEDFSYSVSGTGWAFDSWSYSSNTIEIKVKYSATSSVSKGNHNGTVKLTSKGSSSSSKSATVYAKVDFTPTLTYDNNGTCDISVSDADKTTLDVSTLKTAYTGSDGKAGDGTIKYELKTPDSNVSLTDAGVFYAKATGTYTIKASATANSYYAATAEFTVTVGKRTPTIVWKDYDHIYSGNTLTNPASLTYNGNSVENVGITYTSGNTNVMTVDNDKHELYAQSLQTAQNVVITATTESTPYYESVNTPTKTYHVEAKQTPVFTLNGKTLVAQDTTIRLKIGEKVNMTFEKIDESNNQFTYPTTSGAATYAHNSTAHTGVITAEYFGNRTIVFEQKGTTTIFGQKHNVTVYVDKHPVTLATTTAFNNKTWLVDDSFEGDIYTVTPTPANGQPAQNDVTVTSSNEKVLKLVDNKWKAMGEGDATLTIAQKYNDFWTGDTITTANIHVSKHTPTITWNNDLNSQRPWGAVINTPVSSSNTDIPFTLVSSDKTVADYVDGKIEVYNVSGSVKFTLTQAGNDKWNAATTNTTKTFSAYKPNNHVEFTISNSNHTTFEHQFSSNNASWYNSSYYRLGDGGWSTLETYVIIHFTGIPDKLSFDRQLEKSLGQLPGTSNCFVYESANGTNWSSSPVKSFTERTEKESAQNVQLSPSTRYLKFYYQGTVRCQYKNIKITERKEIVAPATYEFPSGGIGDNPTVRYIPVEWYNVRTCTVTISGTDAKYFKLGAHSDTIDSHVDQYNTSNIEVSYLHEEIKKELHTATLHIQSEDGKTADVILSGETTKATQEIIWNEDLLSEGRILIANGAVYGDIATASSGESVQLTSGDPAKLTVLEDGSIKGLAEGSVQLYAYQAGDNKWAEARDTIYVDITNKTVQHIIWDDPLSNIQREEGQTITKPLNAQSDVKDVDLPIKYELDNDAKAFASISNGVLTITGWGTGKITAKQEGTNTYAPVSVTRTLMSYNPNPSCDPSTVLTKSSITVKTTSSVTNQEYDWAGEPGTLSFTLSIGSGSLLVAEYYNNDWHILDTYSSSSDNGYHEYNLNRKTTKIRFQTTIVIALPKNHTISGLTVTQAKYLEVDNKDNLDFSTVQLGQTVKRSFTVNYSDISGVLEVGLQNPSDQFELQTLTLGSGCGSTKKGDVVKINCTGKNKGEENNAIVIKNKKETLVVPIKATVTGLTQQIHWNHGESEEIATTDNITFSATADSELPVTFSSSDNDIAEVKKVNNEYVLEIKQGNQEVTITATQAGNETWEPTSKSCVFTINKVTPTVSKDPTADEVILPKTLAECAIHNDHEASVDGSFEWKTPSTSIERNNTGYTAVFTPTNSDWYNTVERTIVVPVAKTPQEINWTVEEADRTIYCNANITFNVTATGKTAVYFESSKAQIAYIDDDQVLRISQGGEVTLTAKTDGSETFASAEKSYTFTIQRVSPEIDTYPVADTMKVGGLLSDATIRGGLVKLGNATVEGSFSWVDGNTTAMDVAGKFQKEILFTPTEAGWYEPVTGKKLEVVVEKYAPIISQMGLTAADITYGDVLSGTTGLSGSIDATDTVKKPNIPVFGTYEWVNKAELYDVHTATATAVFKPTNNAWYNDVEFEVPITVLPKQLTTCTATAELAFGQKLSEAVFTNTTTGLSGEDVDGNITWNENVNTNVILAVQDDPYEFDINFESRSDNYADGYGKCYVTIIPGVVFNGEGGNTTWSNDDNWLGGDKPESTDRVVVDANVDITGNITIGGLTINAGNTVTVTDGATLTIGEQSSLYREAGYGNIVVEAGGQLILSEDERSDHGNVQVNDFTLYSGYDEGLPKSGQVSNPTKIHANGNAYFILELDPAGEASYGWYDFTVPFPVNVMTGVARSADGINWDTNIQNEKNYAVMAFYEELRAQDQYAWKKFRGILEPGRAYTMTIDSKINTYRFAMTQEGTFNTTMTQALEASAEGEENGWNGVGNGTMQYIKLSEQPVVQMYQHTSNVYLPVDAGSQALAVGSAYFVQKSEQLSRLTLVPVQDATSVLRAPQRERETDERFGVTLTQDGKTCDNLFVTCSDEATTAYTRGKDVQKMGDIEGAKIARLWTNAKGKNLCAIYTACTGNATVIPMNIYAPAAGAYNIALTSLPEEDIYLTRNGVIVWDLTMSDYTLDLNAGTDNTYALMVVRRINNTATGVDATDNDKRGTDFVKKIIVNDQLFILRDGIMYDAQGKRVTEKY